MKYALSRRFGGSHPGSRPGRLGSLIATLGLVASGLGCSSEDTTNVNELRPDGSGGSAPPTDVDPGVGGSGGSGPTGDADAGSPAASSPGARFVGPGLGVVVERVIQSPGFAVEFSLQDADGRPLDREGILTEGAVSTSFILAVLNENDVGESLQYRAYTLREQESASGRRELQSATDSGGSYEVVDAASGLYRYVFGTPIDVADDDADETHTLGIYATREFQGARYVENVQHSFVPSGAPVETTLDVVTDAACETCHSRVEAHGGARRGVQTCVLCHTPDNSVDPDTGNTFDFQVMIHKIHAGSQLPSVQAGERYQIIGFRQSVHDYSDVEFPGDLLNCEACHAGSQGNRWRTRFPASACTSCHDRTYFGEGSAPEGFEAHAAGPRQPDECVVCHRDDSLAPVATYHGEVAIAPPEPRVAVEIRGIDQTAPGELPQLRFAVRVGGAMRDVIAQRMDRLRMLVSGPNSDYSGFWLESFEGAPACGEPAVAPCLAPEGDGFRYHASTPIPADATGSFTVGMEARIVIDEVRHIADNPTLPFLVTGSAVETRREVVDLAHCNSCHQDLAFHGGNRRTPEYCVMCHNPAFVSDDAPLEGQSESFPSLNFKDLIHQIHASGEYPDSLANCGQCHLNGTAGLPLPVGLLPSQSARRTCVEDPGVDEDDACAEADVATVVAERPPIAAACLGCHQSESAAVHAEVNTSPAGGESCPTCHQDGRSEGLDRVHAPEP